MIKILNNREYKMTAPLNQQDALKQMNQIIQQCQDLAPAFWQNSDISNLQTGLETIQGKMQQLQSAIKEMPGHQFEKLGNALNNCLKDLPILIDEASKNQRSDFGTHFFDTFLNKDIKQVYQVVNYVFMTPQDVGNTIKWLNAESDRIEQYYKEGVTDMGDQVTGELNDLLVGIKDRPGTENLTNSLKLCLEDAKYLGDKDPTKFASSLESYRQHLQQVNMNFQKWIAQ